eukprot:TRINITY_DN9306_c0_g1_i1.p2 TRINITY_DN9306_c0_g1~~TRINITY_DN9306_c0_g1_i1.p2  ORF type:complete len:385 (+),score=67.75 TRINITY_DN9306_c0_g1_i1:84-1157(+)
MARSPPREGAGQDNDALRWQCESCNFKNRIVNAVCGGQGGSLGCKKPRPPQWDRVAAEALKSAPATTPPKQSGGMRVQYSAQGDVTPVCSDWQKGSCTRARCRFRHPQDSSVAHLVAAQAAQMLALADPVEMQFLRDLAICQAAGNLPGVGVLPSLPGPGGLASIPGLAAALPGLVPVLPDQPAPGMPAPQPGGTMPPPMGMPAPDAASRGPPPGLMGAPLGPGAPPMMPPPQDPGRDVPICWDYTNNGVCARQRSGHPCRYRHLPKDHPDIMTDSRSRGPPPGGPPRFPMPPPGMPFPPGMPPFIPAPHHGRGRSRSRSASRHRRRRRDGSGSEGSRRRRRDSSRGRRRHSSSRSR